MSETVLHKGLTPERWNRFPLERRLGMITSEFVRAGHLMADDDGRHDVQRCYARARELLTWTIQGLSAEDLVAAWLTAVIRAIDEADCERWDGARLAEHAHHLSAMVSRTSAQDRAS